MLLPLFPWNTALKLKLEGVMSSLYWKVRGQQRRAGPAEFPEPNLLIDHLLQLRARSC